jgi:GR25 family glycosyltransferase involved in LPS biosynthesis
MKVEGFIIHLKRAAERRAQAEALAAKMPVPMHILDAVDAAEISDADVARVYRRHIHSPRYPFELRRTEVACFLSHRKAWRAILDSGLDAGLIAEDDVDVVDGRFRPAYSLAIARIMQGDYIRFPVREGAEKGRVLAERDGATLIKPRVIGLGMQMQLVGREAAKALLAATEQFDRPVDTTIQVPGLVRTRVLSVGPAGILHVHKQVGGTTVQKKKKALSEVLSREVKRGIYRLAINLKNRNST